MLSIISLLLYAGSLKTISADNMSNSRVFIFRIPFHDVLQIHANREQYCHIGLLTATAATAAAATTTTAAAAEITTTTTARVV